MRFGRVVASWKSDTLRFDFDRQHLSALFCSIQRGAGHVRSLSCSAFVIDPMAPCLAFRSALTRRPHVTATSRTVRVRCDAEEPSMSLGTSGGEKTEFVAETLLPTRSGAFRVRAYRHTVRCIDNFFSRSCQFARFLPSDTLATRWECEGPEHRSTFAEPVYLHSVSMFVCQCLSKFLMRRCSDVASVLYRAEVEGNLAARAVRPAERRKITLGNRSCSLCGEGIPASLILLSSIAISIPD